MNDILMTYPAVGKVKQKRVSLEEFYFDNIEVRVVRQDSHHTRLINRYEVSVGRKTLKNHIYRLPIYVHNLKIIKFENSR